MQASANPLDSGACPSIAPTAWSICIWCCICIRCCCTLACNCSWSCHSCCSASLLNGLSAEEGGEEEDEDEDEGAAATPAVRPAPPLFSSMRRRELLPVFGGFVGGPPPELPHNFSSANAVSLVLRSGGSAAALEARRSSPFAECALAVPFFSPPLRCRLLPLPELDGKHFWEKISSGRVAMWRRPAGSGAAASSVARPCR